MLNKTKTQHEEEEMRWLMEIIIACHRNEQTNRVSGRVSVKLKGAENRTNEMKQKEIKEFKRFSFNICGPVALGPAIGPQRKRWPRAPPGPRWNP